MKKKIRSFLIVVIMVIIATTSFGCSKDKVDLPKVVKNVSGKENISVPKSWKETNNLNTAALLQVSNSDEEEYAIVIGEGKANFNENTTLANFTKLVKDNMKKNIANSDISKEKDMKLDGKSANYFELTGQSQSKNITYMVITVINSGKYYQVIGWTLTSEFDNNKKEMKAVLESFKFDN